MWFMVVMNNRSPGTESIEGAATPVPGSWYRPDPGIECLIGHDYRLRFLETEHTRFVIAVVFDSRFVGS